MKVDLALRAAGVVLAALVLAACGGGNSSGGPAPVPSGGPTPTPAPTPTPKGSIAHVIIVVQENRSFNEIFMGFKGAEYSTFGYTSEGRRVKLRRRSFHGWDLSHDWYSAIEAWDNGKMDRFDKESRQPSGGPAGLVMYSYLKRGDVAPYWTMAQQYTLADQMFPTMFGESFTAHLDLIASTANLRPDESLTDIPSASNAPWGCDAPPGTVTTLLKLDRSVDVNGGPFPCFTQFRTMADTLDAAGVSWRYYATPIQRVMAAPWTQFDAIKKVRYGPDWKRNVITPPQAFLTDVRNGNLAQVSWVTPTFENSDHAGNNSDTGPSWVASVVNAVGNSRYWNSSAIVVLWDDWGGWYDPVPPPQLDFRGLGIRVPCIIISPYAKAHTVIHTQYEFGSVLKFVEEVFDLPPLGGDGPGSLLYTDGRANSLSDSFDFSQSPLPFVTIPARYPESSFMHQRTSGKPPDD